MIYSIEDNENSWHCPVANKIEAASLLFQSVHEEDLDNVLQNQ